MLETYASSILGLDILRGLEPCPILPLNTPAPVFMGDAAEASNVAAFSTIRTNWNALHSGDQAAYNLSLGTVWRHEKVGRIVIVFRCLREESIYNVGASLYRLAAGRWDER
jgi:hypothetical protein